MMACTGRSGFAQTFMSEYVNEVKLNVLTSLFLYPEINYERVKTDYFGSPDDKIGFGVSASALLFNSDFEYYREIAGILGTYKILPYCRFYFSKFDEFLYHVGLKRPSLFFIEINAAIFGYAEETESGHEVGYKQHTAFGLGLAVGKKYVRMQNNTAEIYFGLGWGCSNFKEKEFYPYLRLGVNLGRRF